MSRILIRVSSFDFTQDVLSIVEWAPTIIVTDIEIGGYMIFAIVIFSAVFALVKYLSLNSVIGVLIGIQFAMAINKKWPSNKKITAWLFHIVYICVTIAMILLLAEYISGEIITVCALWAISSVMFGYRETLLMMRSSSAAEKK